MKYSSRSAQYKRCLSRELPNSVVGCFPSVSKSILYVNPAQFSWTISFFGLRRAWGERNIWWLTLVMEGKSSSVWFFRIDGRRSSWWSFCERSKWTQRSLWLISILFGRKSDTDVLLVTHGCNQANSRYMPLVSLSWLDVIYSGVRNKLRLYKLRKRNLFNQKYLWLIFFCLSNFFK